MRSSRVLIALFILASFTFASVASAGLLNPKKIKKWSKEDQTLTRALDAWMSDAELEILQDLKTTEERNAFLKESGHLKRWEDIEDEMLPLVIEGEVVPGMNKDEVFMCWDKPKKIRKDFKRDAYVDVLNYEFERDRKGREFLLRPDSQTSYKNEVFTRFVYMHNGLVFSIVEEGQEENVMDDLPVEDKPEPVEPDRDRVEDVLDDEDLPPED